MFHTTRIRLVTLVLSATLAVSLTGCTSFSDYVRNGYKVGPNYCQPPAPVAEHWIDQNDLHTEPNPESLCHWWTLFNDPKLNELIVCAYRQNLSLKEAGFRILQARASRQIAVGSIFPQTQTGVGGYSRTATAGDFNDQYNAGFNLAWELDFWGRFRRAIIAADANLEASIYGYDAVLVTLLGDVASNYVQVRTDEERIRLLQYNVDHVQMEILRRARLRAGLDLQSGQKRPEGGLVTEADADVAESTLKQTTASITQLELDKRQSENQLCILMGMPPVDLQNMLGKAPIPVSPPEVVLGIPADLLRRRPDVRKAERLAAAQAEQIGIAEAALYPAFSITGTLGYQANNFPQLFTPDSFNGSVGPSFQWNLLNYGRITGNVKLQDAKFQELVVTYQRTVLEANQEVEDGIVTFLQAQRRAKDLYEAVIAQAKAVDIAKARYLLGAGGESSFSTYTLYEQNLLTEQDTSAQARGQIIQGLILIYRALGGGWEIRLGGPEGGMPPAPNPPERIPTPPNMPNTATPPLPVPPAPVPPAPARTP